MDSKWEAWAKAEVAKVYAELFGTKPLPATGYVNEWLRRQERAGGVWATRVANSGRSGPDATGDGVMALGSTSMTVREATGWEGVAAEPLVHAAVVGGNSSVLREMMRRQVARQWLDTMRWAVRVAKWESREKLP